MSYYILEIYRKPPADWLKAYELTCRIRCLGGWRNCREDIIEHTGCLTFEFCSREKALHAAESLRQRGEHVEGPMENAATTMLPRRSAFVGPGAIRVTDHDNGYNYEVGGNCPVQADGIVRDRQLYFRARHEHWSFEVANLEGGFPSDGVEGGFYLEGEYPNAGWMPVVEASKIIDQSLEEYLGKTDKN